MDFLDEIVLHVRAGNGGNGCVAFRREKYVARGGPAGGDGGHGGSVVLIGDRNRNTLYHLRNRSVYEAERGRHGEGSNKTGRSGQDFEVDVPLGTIVEDSETGERLGEVVAEGERLVVAQGGRGGRGNARFATPTRQAPRRADPGQPGEEFRLRLELQLLADVGLVGLPNAGKSTLVSSVSAARPKIADYPFTTLVPQLGMVAESPELEPFVIADLPGLIAGAAEGAGLGHRFLRHVERCRVLAHLVDLSSEGDAEREFLTIEHELASFDRSLMRRPRVLVGSKVDAATEERSDTLRSIAADRDFEYFEVSAVTRDGLPELLFGLRRYLAEADAAEAAAETRTAGPGGEQE